MNMERIVQKTTHHPPVGEQEVVLKFIPKNAKDRKKLLKLKKAIGAIPELLSQDVNTVTRMAGRKKIWRFEIFIQI